MNKYFYCIVIFSFFNKMVAQGIDTLNSIPLHPVVFTANRSEQSLQEVGKTVQIISKNEILNSGSISLTELLSQYAGIFSVGANQTPGQLQTITSRGANTNQSNILIDGVKLSNASSNDNIVDLAEISLSNIERIEIVRGNQSSLFGTSSIGTTINLITTQSKESGWHGNQQLRYGNIGKNTSLVDQNFNLSYQFSNGIYSSFSFFNNQTRGINATVDTITDIANFKYKNNDQDDFRKRELWYKLGITKTKWSAFVLYRNNRQYSDLDKGAFNDDDNFFSNSKRNSLISNIRFDISPRLSASIISGISRLHYQFTDDSSAVDKFGTTDHSYIDGDYKTTSFNTDLQLTHKSKYIRNTIGYHYNKDAMQFANYFFSYSPIFGVFELNTVLDSSLYSIRNNAVFINSDINLGILNSSLAKLNLNLSARNTSNSAFNNFSSFEINPYYRFSERFIGFFNYSNSFVAPSIYQLYAPDQSAFNGITRGNSNLIPEYSNSVELGFRHLINNKLHYSFSIYQNLTKNNIDFIYLWNPNKPIDSLGFLDYNGDSYINLGKRSTYGIDGSISYIPNNKLSFSLLFNIVDGKIKYRTQDLDTIHIGNNNIQLYNSGLFVNRNNVSSPLTRKPTTINFSCDYNLFRNLDAGINYRYIGSRNDVYYEYALGPFGALASERLKAVGIIDLKLKYRLRSNAQFQLRIENVLNTKYSDILGYANRGISSYGQVLFNF